MDIEMLDYLLKEYAKRMYPIQYLDKSHGLGMGYGDFEKLIKAVAQGLKNGD